LTIITGASDATITLFSPEPSKGSTAVTDPQQATPMGTLDPSVQDIWKAGLGQ